MYKTDRHPFWRMQLSTTHPAAGTYATLGSLGSDRSLGHLQTTQKNPRAAYPTKSHQKSLQGNAKTQPKKVQVILSATLLDTSLTIVWI